MSSRSGSPSPKRIKLEDPADNEKDVVLPEENDEDTEEDQCSICLHPIVDRTVIPPCSHDMFCFECITVWSEQSRRCPLCTQPIGDHLIHNIRSNWDYQKFFLPPLRSSVPPAPLAPMSSRQVNNDVSQRRRTVRERQWGRRERENREEEDRFERSLERRRRLYQLGLYAKHTASNPHTKFRPYPTPSQFASNPELIARATAFLRRELRVWVNLDVEFLTTFTISIMKSLDIRTEGAVKLLSEFLDMDERGIVEPNRRIAQHFAHEVYSFMRSPYKDLFVYDTVAQYDSLPGHDQPRPSGSSESRNECREQSRSRSRHQSRSRSNSYSPSGRHHDRVDNEPSDAYYISTGNEYSSSRRHRKGKERERSWDRGRSPGRGHRFNHTNHSRNRSPNACMSSFSKGKQPERPFSRSLSPVEGPEPIDQSVGRSNESPRPESQRASSTTLSDRDFPPRNKTPVSVPDPPKEVPPTKVVRAPKYRTLQQTVQEHLGAAKLPKNETLIGRLTFDDETLTPSSVVEPSPPSPAPVSELTSDPMSNPANEGGRKALDSNMGLEEKAGTMTGRSLLLRRLLEEKKRSSLAPDTAAMENDLRQKIRGRRRTSDSLNAHEIDKH